MCRSIETLLLCLPSWAGMDSENSVRRLGRQCVAASKHTTCYFHRQPPLLVGCLVSAKMFHVLRKQLLIDRRARLWRNEKIKKLPRFDELGGIEEKYLGTLFACTTGSPSRKSARYEELPWPLNIDAPRTMFPALRLLSAGCECSNPFTCKA